MTYLFQTNIELEGGLPLYMYQLGCEIKIPQEPKASLLPSLTLPSSLASAIKANDGHPSVYKRVSHCGSF